MNLFDMDQKYADVMSINDVIGSIKAHNAVPNDAVPK